MGVPFSIPTRSAFVRVDLPVFEIAIASSEIPDTVARCVLEVAIPNALFAGVPLPSAVWQAVQATSAFGWNPTPVTVNGFVIAPGTMNVPFLTWKAIG